MMRAARLLLTTLLLALAGAPAAQAAPPALGGWNHAEQRSVADAGLVAPFVDGAFHGDRRLTGAQLQPALDSLAARTATAPVLAPTGRMSVATFDLILVEQLGLADVAAAVQAEAQRAGLAPPARFGTEVVARQLGLRINHPFPHEELELYPWEPITRAEAAHSLATVLAFQGWEVQDARDVLSRFTLPAYTPAQRRVLRYAVRFIGMPYIWGGELDTRSSLLGGQPHGGYDCSGLVWRVFKLSGFREGARIGGRTAAQMAGEIPKAARLRFDQVQPADVLFFGPGRFWQRATEGRIVHTGIALGNGFMLHSSSQGVYVSAVEGWRLDEFSWARRVL